MRKRIGSSEGAMTIEALGLMAVMVSALMLVFVVGSAYWNLTVLNSAAQSASLSKQTSMDRWCSPAGGNCAHGQSEAQDIERDILAEAKKSMIMGQEQGAVMIDSSKSKIQQVSDTAGTGPLPNNSTGLACAGWSYSYSEFKLMFKPMGFEPVPIRAGSLTLSYQQPSVVGPGC